MADAFGDEIRKLLDGVNNMGVMYAGWENPTNQPGQKAANGSYATPFDRQGGSNVAEQETEILSRGILDRFLRDPEGTKEAMRKVMDVLEGKGQSPTDKAANLAPGAMGEGTQFQYGGQLSAPVAATPQANGFTLTGDEAIRYQAFRAAEEKRKDDEAKESEKKKEEDKMLSLFASDTFQKQLAQTLFPAINAMVSAAVGQNSAAMSAGAQTANLQGAQFSQPVANAPQGSGISAGAFRDLPGVLMPNNMGQQNGAMSAAVGENPNQTLANRFLQEAEKVKASIQDSFQRSRVEEATRSLYIGILSGQPISIDEPLVQTIAQQAGVPFTDLGFGGVR